MAPARRWLLIAGSCALALVATYLLAVWTRPGQELENAALRGADDVVNRSENVAANDALDEITLYSLIGACLLIGLIGLLRRRVDLAIAGVGVIVAGQVVTQGLKRFLLVRPELVDVTGDFKGNSLPSGHTTIAMTVLFAALIVVPYRLRGVAMFLTLNWAVGIGAYTLTAKWHRLSDTIAADAVALGLACLASWWLSRRGAVHEYTGRRYVPRVVLVVLVGLYAAAGLVLAGILWGVPIVREGFRAAVTDSEWPLYLGATSLATVGSALSALVFWGSWRRLEAGRATAAAEPAEPRG
ncbi:phosphoesterase PA-phosphatase related protein [Kribbella flavida DSM 17836]|uniref:Phosphoesterase PA-phosphatase related protein n=1 Tax=Kribbella flavida (strain DSM 17836 / JCM 10339 / NBRC 14399) TaxID=479435 RepID=D2PPE4_KRIFD|nr:phosphatase PAP2 family protein [Kribbella flavida]ADB30906.1 phosphoesterase PA-phosphatase related protein [Kribbella flavida DSM 17836]